MENIANSGIEATGKRKGTEKGRKGGVVNLRKRENGFPMKILESEDYFVVEAQLEGFEVDEISVCLTSRIVTISAWSLP